MTRSFFLVFILFISTDAIALRGAEEQQQEKEQKKRQRKCRRVLKNRLQDFEKEEENLMKGCEASVDEFWACQEKQKENKRKGNKQSGNCLSTFLGKICKAADKTYKASTGKKKPGMCVYTATLQ